MSRLVWTETRDGWQSGRYQIELAAPKLWVLSRRPRRDEGPMSPCLVIRTAGSLRELMRAAAESERRRVRRRDLLIHLALAVTLAGIAIAAAMLDWGVVVPAVIGVFAISLRTLVIWVETATGNAWAVLAEHYQ